MLKDSISTYLVLILLTFNFVTPASVNRNEDFSDRESTNLNSFDGENSDQPVYMLISTSSKIYCMKVPEFLINEQTNYSPIDLEKYEIIYEEKSPHSNWITDAFYVKSEDLIYVNVYNSSSASSDIFTLKYDLSKAEWMKNVLYKDQSYCLGISYNEAKKELYWTASKSIIAGSSVYPLVKKTLFHLNSAKKLLYLEFDKSDETIYVSALNYVYACSLKQSENEQCLVIERNLVSARGLYLDPIERDLYVVDHKKRNIKKIHLKNIHTSSINQDDVDSYNIKNQEMKTTTTILSQEKVNDLGDVFYLTLYNSRLNPKQRMIIWSEFSGKIKMANLNNISNYTVIFSANEYTYSINIMDNSTYLSNVKKSKSQLSASTVSTKSTDIETTTNSTIKTTSITTSSRSLDPDLIEKQESHSKYQESQLKHDEFNEKIDLYDLADYNRNQESEEYPNDNREQNRYIESSTKLEGIKYSSKYEKDEDVHKTLSSLISTIEPNSSYSSTTLTVTHLKSTQDLLKEDSKPIYSNIFKTSENSDDLESSIEKSEKEREQETNKVQSFRAIFKNNLERRLEQSEHLATSASSSSYNLLRSTPQLNMALYIVICLLCFSLIINIILLYITKIKQNRNKLMISHEICKKIAKTSSQRSDSSIKSSQMVDCNINLINSANDSGTSYVDPDQ